MIGDQNPLADWEDLFDGAEVSGDADRFPSFDQVLEECRRVRAATTSLVDSLSEDDLDQMSARIPDGVERLFGTYRSCLQYTADHWFMHRGQLADARRAAGALSLPSVEEAIRKGRPLIAEFGERHVTTPLGGQGLG